MPSKYLKFFHDNLNSQFQLCFLHLFEECLPRCNGTSKCYLRLFKYIVFILTFIKYQIYVDIIIIFVHNPSLCAHNIGLCNIILVYVIFVQMAFHIHTISIFLSHSKAKMERMAMMAWSGRLTYYTFLISGDRHSIRLQRLPSFHPLEYFNTLYNTYCISFSPFQLLYFFIINCALF